MRSHRLHLRSLIAVAAVLLATAIGPASAGAADEFVPGVTDSSTGVLAELERRNRDADRFIPGVTDSSTGVLRERERKGLEPRVIGPTGSAADSGFDRNDAAIAVGAALAAMAFAASLALVAAGRKRRVAI